MKINLCFSILLLFLFSCTQIDFVLSEGDRTNPLENKTSLDVTNNTSSIFKDQLVFFFGENLHPKYRLIVNANEKKTNRFVEKNQVASKIDYEITINYLLVVETGKCVVLETIEISRFSFTPKSSGYNFGSDSSLNDLYKNVFRDNIKNFLTNAKSSIKSSECIVEN